VLTYRIEVADAQAHLFRVTLSIPQPAPEVRLSLPAWIPGSYLIREFARHLSGLTAHQGSREVALEQLDKATWLARTSGAAALTVHYVVYAFDTSVRAAFLDHRRAFFNGTSVALRVEGREAESHRVVLRDLPAHWQVATALRPVDVDAAGRGAYEAADYDELVDHPVELGRFWRGRFDAGGAAHEFVVAGAWPDFDGERLIADTKKICETAIAFWHGRKKAPFPRYVFLLNAVDEGQGGLEHRASTALIAARRDLPRKGEAEASDGYVNVLGLISHEYFHTWNVKRMRPSEFARYDYRAENYSKLLWFFEGFTSYYDDLLLLRAGLIDPARYLRLIGKTIGNVLATPGRQVQSVAQASFDAWVKYYRSDENTPNATISYYQKGSLVALALDLTLRRESRDGSASLDAVMARLWQASGGGPIGEADVAQALRAVGGRGYDAELAAWVHGTDDLPLQGLLDAAGVEWSTQPATLGQRLGMRVSESALTGIRVTHVLRGGAAERAGLAAGDEILAVGGWRLRRLDDAPRLHGGDAAAPWVVVRDQQLLTLNVTLPGADAAIGGIGLALQAKPGKAALAVRHGWLGS
jgi:predicted metalloprotease with PDZ domain